MLFSTSALKILLVLYNNYSYHDSILYNLNQQSFLDYNNDACLLKLGVVLKGHKIFWSITTLSAHHGMRIVLGLPKPKLTRSFSAKLTGSVNKLTEFIYLGESVCSREVQTLFS